MAVSVVLLRILRETSPARTYSLRPIGMNAQRCTAPFGTYIPDCLPSNGPNSKWDLIGEL